MTTKPVRPAHEIPPLVMGRDVFTIGHLSRLVGVSAHTAARWFDEGLLVGYRIPCGDRRILLAEAIAFCRREGMDCVADRLLRIVGRRVLLVGLEDALALVVGKAIEDAAACTRAATLFEAGMLVRELSPHVVVLDASQGRRECALAAKAIASGSGSGGSPAAVLYLAAEDDPGELPGATTLRRPLDPALLASALRQALGVADSPLPKRLPGRRTGRPRDPTVRPKE